MVGYPNNPNSGNFGNQSNFQSVNSQQMVQPVSQTSVGMQPPQPNGYSESNIGEKKPKVIQIISILFFFIAILYGIGTVRILGVLLILNKVSATEGLNFLFLRDFPTYGLIPIIYSIVTLMLFYSAIKVRNGSKFSFWLGTILLSFVFIPLSIITIILLLPLYNITGNTTPSSPSLNTLNIKSFADPALILYFFTLVTLVVSFRKFHFGNTNTSGKSKVVLIILTMLLVVPTISILTYGYIQANDKSYGYNSAQSKVNYHIYKPSYLPQGLTYGSNFSNNKEMAGKNNAIQVFYSPPINQKVESEDTPVSLVILKQVQVEEGFDLNPYISSRYKSAYTTKQVSVSQSLNQQAIYLEGKINKGLVFVTQDHVLINVDAVAISSEELMRIAESLK